MVENKFNSSPKNTKFLLKIIIGKCDKHNCRFVHEKSEVRICKKLMKTGKCDDPKCRLQHSPDPSLMPVCRHFLRGSCVNDSVFFFLYYFLFFNS